jgi:diguanylate cyclase (GGDEF)-like protein/PAS domain S-box-containing protein
MENEPGPQPVTQAESSRVSFRNRLLRPSLGKKLSLVFLLFLVLMVGNLIFAVRLYDGIADTANIVNESGRLRYLSQEIAFHSARLAYEKHQDNELLRQLRDEYEETLVKIELAMRQLPPIVDGETNGLPMLLKDMREAWRDCRSVVDQILNSPGKVEASIVVSHLDAHSAAMLGISNAIANELTRASGKAHSRADFILYVILVVEGMLILAFFFYLRHKIILPVREISHLVSRFAAGDHSARSDFKSRDELGDLARNFNQTAEAVGQLIHDLHENFKETTALQRATQILQDERRPVGEVMQELVLILPSAFRNPEKRVARIVYEGETFVTPGFQESRLRLGADFSRGGSRLDTVEVYRLDEVSAGEEAFLEEEQALLKSLAEMLRSYLGRSRAQLSRGRLVAILEATPDFVSTSTPDGKLLYVNHAGREMLGLGMEDITRYAIDHCHPEWARKIIMDVGMPAAMRDGIWVGETALLHRDGLEIPTSQVIIAHKTKDGTVNYFSTIARDIADRIELESRLTESRDFYLKVFQSFPHMIWRSGIDGRCDYFNKTWLDFTGRKLEQEFGNGWVEGVHPDDSDACLRSYQGAFHEHEAFEIEYRLRRHDGEYRWIVDNGAPFEDLNGAFAGYIGACHDVTERKLMEEKARKLSLVVEEMGNSVMIADLQGTIEYVNPCFSKMSGYSFEEAVGQKPGMLKSGLTSPEYYRSMWQTLVAGNEWRGELLNRKKSGELFWEYEVISVLKNAGGENTHFVAVKEDITERKHQDERLRLWERAIESSVNAVLITDATHPGNPLIYTNPAFERITGYSQEEALGRNSNFLQNDDRDQPDLKELRQAIREQREGRAVLRNYRKDGSMFWNELLIAPVRDEKGDKVTHFIGVQNDVTERMSYESQLEHQANYDTLTGLPNRNLLQDRLGQTLAYARRHERELALLFIDLDYFKNINDSLGHNAGDQLLKLVAARLAGSVREGDTVSRQGGDEFVVILSDVAAAEDVTLVTQKILHVMSESFDVDGRELYVTCSIGIALYPKDGKDGQTLLKNADAALYRAKDMGRNNAQFYAAEMNLKAMERLVLENGLRHALERNEFLLHYQPQVDLRSGEINGMEALVRWQHPELGLVSPVSFIPVAEESGLIVALGEWVLRTACAQNKAWQRAGLKPISVAVNLSARQFRQPNLVEVVAGILRETELDPAHLELELTESLVMQNVEATIATLGRFKAMGIKLSIDDFGTGYSSLSYLKRFPIHTLKVDQSFVRDIITNPDDAAIAKAIISMAHDLQLRVIAEGVETEAQKTFLQQCRCDDMQGFFFSKPVPAEAFEVLLRERVCLQMADSTAALGQRTLLLLDDEENILTSLARLLRRDGYEILKATTATAAFDLLASHPVGVIISDQRMPEMNGTEFLRRVKQIYPGTVRMVLSGYTDLKSVTDAINEGAVYKFLTKPWDDELLRANIQEAFQRYELAQDNQRLSDEMASINEELNRAKRELEKRMERKASEARHSVGVLQVSQEMLEYLPVGVIGVGEDGLIAVANRKANELLAGDQPPLVGSIASERLPAAMIECLAGAGERRTQRLENGRDVIFWSHLMGASSGSEGQVLVIVPNEESGG